MEYIVDKSVTTNHLLDIRIRKTSLTERFISFGMFVALFLLRKLKMIKIKVEQENYVHCFFNLLVSIFITQNKTLFFYGFSMRHQM